MSAQFLEAVSKVPGALTEQQKKTLEEARRMSASSQLGGQQSAEPIPGPGSAGSVPVQLPPAQIGNTPNTPKALQMTQLSNNPAMLLQWIKSREEAMKVKFRKCRTTTAIFPY